MEFFFKKNYYYYLNIIIRDVSSERPLLPGSSISQNPRRRRRRAPMMAALRSSFSSIRMQPWTHLGLLRSAFCSSSSSSFGQKGFLDLEEVEKILSDVKADDVRVIPVGDQCEWTDYMVVATGRSAWHVRNIAQALIYKAKSLFPPLFFSFSFVSVIFWSSFRLF